jgi:hypothetical protein
MNDERLRIGAAIMWASLLLFGVPAIALTWLNSRSHLALVLTLVGAGSVVAAMTTLRRWRRRGGARATTPDEAE